MSQPAITVYTANTCQQCHVTKRFLDKNGLTYQEINIDSDPSAREYVTQGLGYTQAPVVVAGDRHWSGFRYELLKSLT